MFKSSKNHHENLSSDYDNTHYNRLMSLIEISQKKGIHLVLLLSPRNSSQDLVNLMQMIPEKNKLNMALTSEKNLPYYLIENSFDIGHMNEKGAVVYSLTSIISTWNNKPKIEIIYFQNISFIIVLYSLIYIIFILFLSFLINIIAQNLTILRIIKILTYSF